MRIVPRDPSGPVVIRACHDLVTAADRHGRAAVVAAPAHGWFKHPADPVRAWSVSDEETGA